MESLFVGLLDISKLEAGVIQPRLGPVSVDALFDRLSQYFRPVARERGLDLRFRSDGEWVTSDEALLEQVMSNLVSNALRCTVHGRRPRRGAPAPWRQPAGSLGHRHRHRRGRPAPDLRRVRPARQRGARQPQRPGAGTVDRAPCGGAAERSDQPPVPDRTGVALLHHAACRAGAVGGRQERGRCRMGIGDASAAVAAGCWPAGNGRRRRPGDPHRAW